MRSNVVVSCLKVMCILLSNVLLLANDPDSKGALLVEMPNYFSIIKQEKQLPCYIEASTTLYRTESSSSCDLGSPLSSSMSSVSNGSLCKIGRWGCQLPQAMKSAPSAVELSILTVLTIVPRDVEYDHGIKTPSQGLMVDHGHGSPSKTPKKCAAKPEPMRTLHGGVNSPSNPTPKKNRGSFSKLLAHGIKTPLEHGNGSPKRDTPAR